MSEETTSQPPVRVLLVEDHAVFRQAMALIFGLDADLEVIGQAGTVAEGRELLDTSIDVAVLDLDLPDGNGASLIHDLHAVNRGAEALVLTASVRKLDLARAVEAGAAGLLHKSTPLDEIVDAVRRIAAGESLVSRRELVELVRLAGEHRATTQAAEQAIARLTRREREVLMALTAGLSDKEIAERLFVSKDTVHTHMVNMLGKLGVESRMQALIFAIKSGLVTLE